MRQTYCSCEMNSDFKLALDYTSPCQELLYEYYTDKKCGVIINLFYQIKSREYVHCTNISRHHFNVDFSLNCNKYQNYPSSNTWSILHTWLMLHISYRSLRSVGVVRLNRK